MTHAHSATGAPRGTRDSAAEAGGATAARGAAIAAAVAATLPAAVVAACAFALALAPRPATAQAGVAAAAAPDTGLWVPRNIEAAIAAGTRTLTGAPGPRYWQNHARYSIDLFLSPPSPTVHGEAEIVYHNESPDTLDHLVFKLIGNIHKPGAARSRGVPPEFLTSGIRIDSFAVNGTVAGFPQGAMVFTTPAVGLPEPLLPGDSVHLAIGWRYDLAPSGPTGAREGVVDATSFFLAYFYPEVAVYDDYQGWDDIAFNGRQEFYTDFNDYDVRVHVPAGFVVWGTGTLHDPERLLQPGALRRYRASLEADAVVHIATADQMLAGRITTPGPPLTWRFTSSHIPDVAFGVSDHYAWDGTSVVVDSATGRRASVQSAYSADAADYPFMTRWAAHALDYFSRRWPGVPYPYEKSTIFQGDADMEYPMMVNDAAEPDTAISRWVAEHEIAHTYMPFYMGIDQTRWGFMDEGWATAFEYFINRANMGEAWADSLFRAVRVRDWITDPSPAEDVAIITPEEILGASVTYAHNAYGKPALGYLAVKDLLGDTLFRRALHAYMATWHGRHPSPWDFFYSFNTTTGRDLDWFWQRWFFANSYIDRRLVGVARTGDGYRLSVRNVGGMPAPFDVVLTFADGSTRRVHQTPAVWKADPDMATFTVPTDRPVRAIRLDGGIWMDATPADDGWTTPE